MERLDVVKRNADKCQPSTLGMGIIKIFFCFCQETIAATKTDNLKRHYKTKHWNFKEAFPQNSELRKTKINALKLSYQAASRIMVTSMTQQ